MFNPLLTYFDTQTGVYLPLDHSVEYEKGDLFKQVYSLLYYHLFIYEEYYVNGKIKRASEL